MKSFFALLVGTVIIFGAYISADNSIANSQSLSKRVVITGTVSDKETGEPIPGVTVQAVGTGFATMANSEGRYRMILPADLYSIKATHVGHYSVNVSINLTDSSLVQDFSMKSSIIDMGVRKVYSRAYDPGQRIILEAIAHKDNILSRITDYEFEAYTKIVITDETKPDTAENDILMIAESQITSFWKQPGDYKEIINSRRQTSNIPAEGNLLSIGEILNFNKNRIDLDEYEVVSPTADDALDHYNYYLIDTVYLDDKPVFVLEIEPKNEFKPLFTGEIHIADSTYEVVRVDVGFSKGMDDPVMKNVRYYQHYAEINGKYWMPIEIGFTFDIHLGLSLMGIPSKMGLIYVAALSDYKIEDGHEKGTFDEFKLVVAPTADNFDSTIWATRMTLPLTKEQEFGYVYIDSVENAPKPLLKKAERIVLGATFLMLFGDRDIFHFNRVDGYYFGLPIRISPKPEINIRALNGYGLEDDRWQYDYSIDYRLSMKRHLWLGGSVRNKNVRRRSITFVPELNETFGALIFGMDPNVYYREKGFEIHSSLKTVDKSWLKVGFNSFEYESLPRRTTYTLFGDSSKVQSNMGISEGKKRSFSASFRYDSRPLMNNKGRVETLPTSKYITCEFGIEYSSPDIAKSEFDFTRYFAKVNGQFNTLGIGTTSIFAFAGASEGNLPAQDRFVASYMDWGIYQTMGLITFPDTSFAGDRMIYIFAEHDFGKFMFRNSGIDFLKQIPAGFSTHGGLMLSEYKDNSIRPEGEIGLAAPRVYYEAGFGVHNLTPWLGIFNLSAKFSWQLSSYDTRDFNVGINFIDF